MRFFAGNSAAAGAVLDSDFDLKKDVIMARERRAIMWSGEDDSFHCCTATAVRVPPAWAGNQLPAGGAAGGSRFGLGGVGAPLAGPAVGETSACPLLHE